MLNIFNIIIFIYILEAVRISYKEMTENEIAEYASKWLAQAAVRIVRQKNETDADK